MLDHQGLEVVRSDRGDIVKISSKRTDPNLDVQEVYLNIVKPLSAKGWIRHSHANLVLIALDQGLEFWQSIQTEPSLDSISVNFFQYSRVGVPAGSWFALKNVQGCDARFLVLSSLLHGQDEVERRTFLY